MMMRAVLLHPVRFHRDHRFTRTQASDYLDGELGPDDRGRIELHTHMPRYRRRTDILSEIVSSRSSRERADSPRRTQLEGWFQAVSGSKSVLGPHSSRRDQALTR